jgi:predicted nucleic acid-binding protein
VIDASLALKWELNDEEFVEQAVAIRDEFLIHKSLHLFAPHLFVFELANGIAVAVRRARVPVADGSQILRRLIAAEVTLTLVLPRRLYEIAMQFQISAYDSAYVALAERLETDLWTADRGLVDAVSHQLPWVRFIGDWIPRQ